MALPPNGFQDRPVMTTSVTLQIGSRKSDGAKAAPVSSGDFYYSLLSAVCQQTEPALSDGMQPRKIALNLSWLLSRILDLERLIPLLCFSKEELS